MRTYPRHTLDGRTVWACCVSSIGPICQHRVGATSELEALGWAAQDYNERLATNSE